MLNGNAWDRCRTCSRVSEKQTFGEFNSDSLHRVQIPAENTATDNIEPTGCERGQRWGHVRLPSRCCPARPKAHMARPPRRTPPVHPPFFFLQTKASLKFNCEPRLLCWCPGECVSGVCVPVFCWASTKTGPIDYLQPRNDVFLAFLKVLPWVIGNISGGRYHFKPKGRPKLDMHAFLRK